MSYPPAPWRLHGDLWLSLFRVSGELYGAAWVVYREPSPLTYHELLVARPRERGAEVTDIWVDSVDSLEGGRALWAIPKDLADFGMEASQAGPVRRTAWHASLGDSPIATARFTDLGALSPPTPYRFHTRQAREDGTPVSAPVRGWGRTLPARASWDVAPDGPLGFLAGHRPLASFHTHAFRMTFG